MIKQLLSLIEKEDKKNPMTDEELAKRLGVGREKVNELRQAADIPNYLIRREASLLGALKAIIASEQNISRRKLVIELNKRGFQISSFGLNRYKQHISVGKNQSVKKIKPENPENLRQFVKTENREPELFSNIIGCNGSLSQTIKLAKAAILYPQYGLHTLISGSTGVGKSQLVEEMHRFAQQVRKKKLPFIVFNCADYGDNPQLLVTQLFGYVKGSFTGADVNKAGLVEKANGGILFLDEIHRLPPKGQEILFRIMDKGEFSRLGETEHTHKANLMIVGATTENVESSLLNTFRRRIPVTIQIPPLEGRPDPERFQLIKLFFAVEASRVGKRIQVPKEIMKLLILYKCAGNVGQLRSDIQVICAKAYVNVLSGGSAVMKISMNDLPVHVKNQLMDSVEQKIELDIFIEEEVEITPQGGPVLLPGKQEFLKYNIYQFIEKRMAELLKGNTSPLEAREVLAAELEAEIRSTTLSIEHQYAGISTALLQDIVGEELMRVVEDIKQILASEMGTQDFSIIKILCLHLSAALERVRTGKPIINPQYESIKSNYKREFRIAGKIIRMLNLKLGMDFPEEEAGFIALYLNHFFVKKRVTQFRENKVGLILVTHGEVAQALLDIAQLIVGIRHGMAITMGMDENIDSVFGRVKEAAKLANQGSGVLLLVDMGSLITFGELITEELGIPTRVIARVDTLLVMEAIRKSVLPTANLFSVYESLIELGDMFPRVPARKNGDAGRKSKKTIITTCFTGRGTALKIKQVIEERLSLLTSNVEVIPLGLMQSETDMAREIVYLQQANRDIILITGMINPCCKNIPFLPFEEILNGQKLEALIANIKLRDELVTTAGEPESSTPVTLESLFDVRLIRIFHSLASKEEIIKIMTGVMCKEQYVNEVFYNDVMERENWATSYIGDGVVIPHTATTVNIIKPGIGIAVIKNTMDWDDAEVRIVFVLALTTEHKDLFLRLYNVIKETDMVEKVCGLSDSKLMIAEVLDYVGAARSSVKDR